MPPEVAPPRPWTRRSHGSPPRDATSASVRWPRATLGDLSLFKSCILNQTDVSIMRGMKKTMDQLGAMAHRAGPGLRTLSSSLDLPFQDKEKVDYCLSSNLAEGHLGGGSHPSSLERVFEDASEGGFEVAGPKETKKLQQAPGPSEPLNRRPISFGGKSGTLDGRAIRQRSQTVVHRKPLPTQSPAAVPMTAASYQKPDNSDNGVFMSLDYDDKLLNAEAIGRLMVAAELGTVESSQAYPLSLEHQEGQASRRRVAHRKDLEQWLGAEAGALPNIKDHPAFVHGTIPETGEHIQKQVSSPSRKTSNLPRVSVGRKSPRHFGHARRLKDISAVRGSTRRPEDAVPLLSKPFPFVAPKESSYERENALRLEMLQKRRNDTDRPEPGRSKLGYPSKEELKAIQNDIRARTVQGWIKTENRGAWHGYTLGF